MKLPFKIVKEVDSSKLIDIKPSMYFNESVIGKLNEQFKGEVENKKIKFPEELGEEHPFNFKITEELYKKFGFFTAIIDKYIDFVVGPGFYIETKDERAKEILEQFMKDVNFDTLMRQWTKEALIKGNGFLEIGGNKEKGVNGLKILNANYMYVVRDKHGKVLGYNQYKGAFNKFAKEKVIKFTDPNSIAHVPFNIVGDCAYGLGIGYTSMALIDNWLSQTRSQHKLMDRKANAPLHAKLGVIDGDTKIIPKAADVAALGKDLETMDNKTNWVTDPLVEFKVVDFGNVGDKFDVILEKDLEMLIYAFQIPAVLLGKANIPEGLAEVQMEAFQRRIQSIQAELEKIIENQIFKRVLNANGFEVDVEFEWGTPNILETAGRISLLTEMIKSPNTGFAMKTMMEKELITLLKFDEDEWEKLKLEEAAQEEEERKRLEAQAQPIVPGQNKGFPKKVAPKKEQPKQPKPIKPKESMDDIMNKINERFDELKKTKLQVKKSIVNEGRKKSLIQPLKKVKEKVIIHNHEYGKICSHCEESWDNLNKIEEWLDFNYKKYLGEILSYLDTYGFDKIKGVNESQIKAGYLTETQVDDLRKVIKNGFSKGKGLKQMAKEVDKKVGLKDLYRLTDEGTIMTGASGLPILSRSADKRAINIVRTEVTKVANSGAVKYYKDNDIKTIKHVASFGDRTCQECEGLNGVIYEIGSEPGLPIHPMCRCTYAPVVELK